jgi:hypothetical protein
VDLDKGKKGTYDHRRGSSGDPRDNSDPKRDPRLGGRASP